MPLTLQYFRAQNQRPYRSNSFKISTAGRGTVTAPDTRKRGRI
jgi:hypothetical protein